MIAKRLHGSTPVTHAHQSRALVKMQVVIQKTWVGLGLCISSQWPQMPVLLVLGPHSAAAGTNGTLLLSDRKF